MTKEERRAFAQRVLSAYPDGYEYDALKFIQGVLKLDTFEEALDLTELDKETYFEELNNSPRKSIKVCKIEIKEDFEALKYLDGPWRNDACLGYMIMALQRTDAPQEVIWEVMYEMKRCFDEYTVEEAAQAYFKF